MSRYGPAAAWMGLIFFLSSQSALPSAPDALVDTVVKKTGHVAGYAVLMILLLRATQPAEPQPAEPPKEADVPPTPRQFWISFAILLAYALSDEIHQSFVPGRTPNWIDALGFDALGGLIGALIWRVYSKFVATHATE